MTTEETQRYLQVLHRLHGKDMLQQTHICQHPGCRTIVIGQFCIRHMEVKHGRG